MSSWLAALAMVAAGALAILVPRLLQRRKALRHFLEAVERGNIDVAIYESERVPSGRIESVVGAADRRHFRLSITTDSRRGVRNFRLFVDFVRFRARRVPIGDIRHPFTRMYLKLKQQLKSRGIKAG